jgi:hypothetical protein
MSEPRPLIHPEEIALTIALERDPILRNLRITQTYHDLSQSLSRALGPDNANWCTFATWASKTAGGFIRASRLAVELRELITGRDGLLSRISALSPSMIAATASLRDPVAWIVGVMERVLVQVGRLIAQGNLKVFEELAPVFSRFLEGFSPSGPDASRIEPLLAGLRAGATEAGGQDLLRDALTAYWEALAEREPRRRAQLMLLGNAEIGMHEQIRLQPYIAGALGAPVRETLIAGLEEQLGGAAADLLDPLLDPLTDMLEDLWERYATREMMRLALPDGPLFLGRDLPAPSGRPLFPAALDQIELPQLRDLLAGLNALEARVAEAQVAADSAAEDWSELKDRMRFITELFRSRQQDPRMMEEPFSREHRDEILAGRVPSKEPI